MMVGLHATVPDRTFHQLGDFRLSPNSDEPQKFADFCNPTGSRHGGTDFIGFDSGGRSKVSPRGQLAPSEVEGGLGRDDDSQIRKTPLPSDCLSKSR